MEFNREELNIILGSLNCYIKKDSLSDDLWDKANELRKQIKKVVKQVEKNT